MTNLPILILALMVILLLRRGTSLFSVCSVAALAVLVLAWNRAPLILTEVAVPMMTIYVVMTTTQAAVSRALLGGGGERLGSGIAGLMAHRRIQNLPASVLIPAIFLPTTMLMAAVAHNLTAIMCLVPVLVSLCGRYGVDPKPTLMAMLVASNLGGASTAVGDTPAILQRMLWHFSVVKFTEAMLPRNMLILALLVTATAFLTWYPTRKTVTDWTNIWHRLEARDMTAAQTQYSVGDRLQARIGGIALLTFLALQLIFPSGALVTSLLVLLVLVALTPQDKRLEIFTVLGMETIVTVFGLFIVAKAVEMTPVVQHLGDIIRLHRGGGIIELSAYFLTSAISADGSAATLAPVVHSATGGDLLAAWRLAGGICAGSSSMLTSASAGPVLYALARKYNHPISFSEYARWGIATSVVMLGIYLSWNVLFQ